LVFLTSPLTPLQPEPSRGLVIYSGWRGEFTLERGRSPLSKSLSPSNLLILILNLRYSLRGIKGVTTTYQPKPNNTILGDNILGSEKKEETIGIIFW
jgi:hypothetical protein